MMVIEKYGTLEAANLSMRGGIATGIKTTDPFVGLVGQTITFATPAGACTFTQPTGRVSGQMHFVEVKAQLEAAVANLVVSSVDNKITFSHATPGSIVSLGVLNEPARAALGLGNGEAITGRFLNPPDGVAPRFVTFVTEVLCVYVAVEV